MVQELSSPIGPLWGKQAETLTLIGLVLVQVVAKVPRLLSLRTTVGCRTNIFLLLLAAHRVFRDVHLFHFDF